MISHIENYIADAISILKTIDQSVIQSMIESLLEIKKNQGRLFFLGVGGSAANGSHAVNDFRKLANIEAYSPCDNIAELTARTNDEGWQTVFVEWLKTSRINHRDGVFVLSVGGGNKENNISSNIVHALNFAKEKQAKIFGIVGRDGGYTAKVGDCVLIIPPLNSQTITPHTESFQAVIWHLITSDPRLMTTQNKWEREKPWSSF